VPRSALHPLLSLVLAAGRSGLLGLLGGCGEDPGRANGDRPDTPALSQLGRTDVEEPPTAVWPTVRQLEEDLAAERHPSDGGGRAWLEPGEDGTVPAARIMQPGRWTVVYEAGPLGVAQGGAIYFQPEPFWEWSAPQDLGQDGPGYTTVATDAEGVELAPETLRGMLAVEVRGRALAAGERVRIVYGAGRAGARADRFAERGAHFWIGVDGDGDGVRANLKDSPTVHVLPGPPERLSLVLPSVARPGERVRLTVAVLDYMADTDVEFEGTVAIGGGPPDLAVVLAKDDRGRRTVELPVGEPGVLRLVGTVVIDGRDVRAESNPLLVSPDAPRLFWGDLHGHSNFSDGTGLPEDYFRYARDVAGLDVIALTDHDHFGGLFLDQNPDLWEAIKHQVAAFHEPGRFVTLLGYEWTSWIHGHRHVLYFGAEGEVHGSLDPEVRTPRQLWARLAGQPALTFAHHSAGLPVPVNWSFAPDPVLEPVTEVMSVHGSSEAADSPAQVRGAIPGNFVRDVLDHGFRLGFVGSGDGHDGHPGLAHLSPQYGWRVDSSGVERMGNGGLAGIFAEELTRESVLAALRARRVYATSGPRIFLEVELRTDALSIDALGTAAIDYVDVIRTGAVFSRTRVAPEREVHGELAVEGLEAGEYVYVRVVQVDGGMAWSSPVFVD